MTVMAVSTPVKDRKVRFALVGCGRIAKNHLSALTAHADDAELVDVCDIDPKALAQNVAAYTVFAYLAAESEGSFGSEAKDVVPPKE